MVVLGAGVVGAGLGDVRGMVPAAVVRAPRPDDRRRRRPSATRVAVTARRTDERRRMLPTSSSASPIVGPSSPADGCGAVASTNAARFATPRARRPPRRERSLGGPTGPACGGSVARWSTSTRSSSRRGPAGPGARIEIVTEPHGGGSTGSAGSHDGDVDGIRPWRDGDSERSVHWPTSLRTGDLVVLDRHRSADTRWIVRVDADADDHEEEAGRARWALDEGRRRGVRTAAAVGDEEPVEITDADAAARWSATCIPDPTRDRARAGSRAARPEAGLPLTPTRQMGDGGGDVHGAHAARRRHRLVATHDRAARGRDGRRRRRDGQDQPIRRGAADRASRLIVALACARRCGGDRGRFGQRVGPARRPARTVAPVPHAARRAARLRVHRPAHGAGRARDLRRRRQLRRRAARRRPARLVARRLGSVLPVGDRADRARRRTACRRATPGASGARVRSSGGSASVRRPARAYGRRPGGRRARHRAAPLVGPGAERARRRSRSRRSSTRPASSTHPASSPAPTARSPSAATPATAHAAR